MSKGIPQYVDAQFSNGRGMAGKQYLYLRPNIKCVNASRKVGAFYRHELFEKAEKVVAKWYEPGIIEYEINGWTIASNNEQNALKEYWRICDKENIGKQFEVKIIPHQS